MRRPPKKVVIEAILEARKELMPFLERLDLERLSKHNRGYLRYSENPLMNFIDAELVRYIHTVNYIYSSSAKSVEILDVGFFIPVLPIALSKLGFKVSAVEKLSYYEGALDEILTFVREKYSIKVLDFNLFGDNPFYTQQKYDVVLLLAILEHLNGTPRHLLYKVRQILRADGYIILEVPNAASLTKRLTLLIRGKLPYSPFEDYFWSEYPFSGHNREYTISDLKYSLYQSGFKLTRMEVFHHSSIKPQHLKGKLLYMLEKIGPSSWKPNIWAVARPK